MNVIYIYTHNQDARLFYYMSEYMSSQDNVKKNDTNKTKQEMSEEQKFVNKKNKRRKKIIEDIRAEEKWEDWSEFQ